MTCQRAGIARGRIGVLGAGLSAVLLSASALAAPAAAASPSAAVAAPIADARAAAVPGSGAPTGTSASVGTAAAAGVTAVPMPLQGLPLDGNKVLAHIKQTLDWYGEAQSIEQLPQLSADVIARDRLRDSALMTVRLAFRFGRAAAAVLPPPPAKPAPSVATGSAARAAPAAGAPATAPSSASSTASSSGAASSSGSNPAGSQAARSFDQVSARVAARIAELESQVMALDARLAHAPARSRAALRGQRDQAAAALALQREVQSAIQDLQRFQSSMLLAQASSSKDLLGQISDLERSVPEVRQSGAAGERGAQSTAAGSGGANGSAGSAAQPGPARGSSSGTTAGSAAIAGFRPESAGIIALIGQWVALQSADSQLGNMQKATDALSKELDGLRTPLVAQARALVRMDVSGLVSSDRSQLEASRSTLEAAAARFRQLAGLLVPLGDQQFALDSARSAVAEWRGSVRSRLGAAARYLLTRVVILATLIAVVLVISEVWRRAAFKYLHDTRRRSQFQTLRRVAVGVALAVIILFALVSQIGSLATYVGFLTAGLAVALQNVILSIVAYFFLIGRYGVRVGDRITLTGVTGRVADIGLIRIYLMELAGSDLHPTGRIVVLSNSVLFQPQALFKQVPGADYLWHAISITLAPTVDIQAAQQRLEATAGAVYEQYRPAIEAQHAEMSRLVDFDTATPRPEVRVRYAEQGWQFDVRYPVQADQAARIDQRMLKAVRDALTDEPQLALAAPGGPVLRDSDK